MLTKNYNVIRNRQAQARWRERHIAKRRRAQRIVNILVRKKWPEGTVKELARLLGQFLTPRQRQNLAPRASSVQGADPQGTSRTQCPRP